jgi:integrase
MKGLVKSEKSRPMTFKEWGESYLKLEGVTRLRSLKDRKEIVVNQLIPFFGKKSLAELKAEDVEAYRAQRTKKNGKPAKLQTINNDHIILKHCLNVARRKGLITVNPATFVPIPNAHNERDRVLTGEEWGSVLAHANDDLKPILLVADHLGQRAGEIIGLTWDRVDLQRGFITLRALDTKTKRPRQIPMTPEVRAAIQELAKVRSLSHKSVIVIQGQPATYEPMRTLFKKAIKKAGIENLRFHDLRHCAATNLSRAGVDTTTAMQIVGHKSPHMWKRYNTVAESDVQTTALKLNSYLANTVITPANSGKAEQAVSA